MILTLIDCFVNFRGGNLFVNDEELKCNKKIKITIIIFSSLYGCDDSFN